MPDMSLTATPNSFIVAVIAGSLFVMIVGVLMERIIIRHFYTRPHEDQLLVTFGLEHCLRRDHSILFRQLVLSRSGAGAIPGITSLGFMFYPTYRLALVGIIAVALLILFSFSIARVSA